MKKLTKRLTLLATLSAFAFVFQSCEQKQKKETKQVEKELIVESEKPEYFLLRPEVEKAYGYSHAVKIGNSIKVSGAVSMDDEGNPTAIGDIEQQMKNCYADLEKILKHFGCTFDDSQLIWHKCWKNQHIELKFIKTDFQLALGLK